MRLLTEIEALKQYEEFLDEIYGKISICGIEFNASYALKELDPIAYDCGFSDFCDSENIEIE